ncbi:MAG: hypothetical protein COT84_01005 [Chlamydiae bacterium CG10_big_fil_rev_8_21_14_0_10_35_9]|nr:MAG: hypothetical protein COT84_01005 [Chlamydiae bacterium CG10_big_fil_rev_8_21_14_0_10_35_9]
MSLSVSAPRADQVFPNGIPISPEPSGRVQDSIQERVNDEAIHIISEQPLNDPDTSLYSPNRKSAVLLASQSKGAKPEGAELIIKTTSILHKAVPKKKKVHSHRVKEVIYDEVLEGIKPKGGEGAMVIYKGKDKWHLPKGLDNNRRLIKFDKNFTFYQKLLREYYTISYLQERNVPHICPVEVAYTSKSKIALAFPRKFSDLLDGLIYLERVKNRASHPKGLALAQIRSISWQLLKFLQKMKQEGAAHLDLKPENILIENNLSVEEPKIFITDFEMAEPVNEKVSVKGTLGYVAPELALQGVCSSADVFSAALILFDLITVTPFYHFDKMCDFDSIYHHLAFLFMHFGVPSNFNFNDIKDTKAKNDLSLKKVFEDLQNKYQEGFKDKILKWGKTVRDKFSSEEYMFFLNFSVHHKSSWNEAISKLFKAKTPLWKIEEELRQQIVNDWEKEVGDFEKDKIKDYLSYLPSYSAKDFLRNNLRQKGDVNDVEEIVNLFMQMADPDPDRRITPKEALQSLFFREDVELEFPEEILAEGHLSLHIRPSDSDKEEDSFYPLIPQENHTHHLVYGGGSFVVTLIDDDSQKTLLEQPISISDHSILQVMYDKEEKSYRMSCRKSKEAIH